MDTSLGYNVNLATALTGYWGFVYTCLFSEKVPSIPTGVALLVVAMAVIALLDEAPAGCWTFNHCVL